MIKVAVCGANGRMGQEVVKAVNSDAETELVAKIDILNGEFSSIEEAHKSKKIDILVDFTQPKSIYENALYCLNNGINIVIGTTGLKDEQIEELKQLSEKNKVACFIAPNFSTGAVLMMKFAQMAAKYFDNAEIIELHHNQKKDAPSGTAVKTAQLMARQTSRLQQEIATKQKLLKAQEAQIHTIIFTFIRLECRVIWLLKRFYLALTGKFFQSGMIQQIELAICLGL